MNIAAAAVVLAPALALGSFLNVVVVRVPARRSLLRPPSSCDGCATQILRRDNVPLLSYALLRGRCRHCDARISPLYPAVELVTAALIAFCFAVLGPGVRAGLAAALCAALVVLAAMAACERGAVSRASSRRLEPSRATRKSDCS